MPLRYKYSNKDQIPSEHSTLYVERDGALILDVEGAVEKNRLDEDLALLWMLKVL